MNLQVWATLPRRADGASEAQALESLPVATSQESGRARVGTCVHPEAHARAAVLQGCITRLLQPLTWLGKASKTQNRPEGLTGSSGTGAVRNQNAPKC